MKTLKIGRTPDNDIVLNRPHVSAHHLEIAKADDGEIVLTDHSLNGTYVNGYRIIGSRRLMQGDKVTVDSVSIPWERYLEEMEDVVKDQESFIHLADSISGTIKSLKDLSSLMDGWKDHGLYQFEQINTSLPKLLDSLAGLSQRIEPFTPSLEPEQLDRLEMLKQVAKETVTDVVSSFKTYFKPFMESLSGNGNESFADILPTSEDNHQYGIFGLTYNLPVWEVFHVSLEKNLLIRYSDNSEDAANNLATTVLAQYLKSHEPGTVCISMIDPDDMVGTNPCLLNLNQNIFSVQVREEDIRKLLDGMAKRVEILIQSVLISPFKTLEEFNRKHEKKEQAHVIVLKHFPVGLGVDSMRFLKMILRNGKKAGIHVVILDKVGNACNLLSPELLNAFEDVNLDGEQKCAPILPEARLQDLIKELNSKLEIRTDEIVPFGDYIPEAADWWKQSSAHHMEIPFGLSEDRHVQKLMITRESGKNSAMVIGIPGSGKSVFLHSIIMNAAINYSPAEVAMYLIDFSGVEFNCYSTRQLPHARIIAPEAEREFGLSTLLEMVEEGKRRMVICRNNGANNYRELRARRPDLEMPCILVIIDEFQKLFENEADSISRQANRSIRIIVQEYAKFGINLILATQRLPSTSVLPRDLIANRIVFKSAPVDLSSLIIWPNNKILPKFRTGQCVYNSESGAAWANVAVQTFFISSSLRESLLDRMSAKASAEVWVRKTPLLVFNSTKQPDFATRRTSSAYDTGADIPSDVPVYLGEAFSIEESHVAAVLSKESNNNILIIGGDKRIAEKIAYYCLASELDIHPDYSASFHIFNFLRQDDPLNADLEVLAMSPFEITVSRKEEEIMTSLQEIKDEIEARQKDEERPLNHIYITIFSFHLGRMFDKGGRRGYEESESAVLLDFILKNGPMYGVFTTLQVDNLANFSRIEANTSFFNHRVALQMDELESNRIIGTSDASKLVIPSRPDILNRAYYFNKAKSLIVKFNPYK